MTHLTDILPEKPKFKGCFINNRWTRTAKPDGVLEQVSPANFDWSLDPIEFSYSHVEEALLLAQRAFEKWKHVSIDDRIALLKKFADQLSHDADYIAKIVSIETGKPFDEAKAEANALKAKVEITIEHGLKLIESQSLSVNDTTRGQIKYRPRGVWAVIGPFNFPVHLNHGHIVPALLTGNVCVLKPSEKTPYSAQAYMQSFEKVGFPSGVLQMIHGEANLSTRLIRSPKIDGVLATCSYEVGGKIQSLVASETEKVVALEMGGKNAAIVWEPNDLPTVADHLIRSSYLTTGQRCTALSRCYVKRELMGDLISLFHERAKKIVISHPFDTDPKPFMGPIISDHAKKTFLKYNAIADQEGAEVIMRPKQLEGIPRIGKEKLPNGFYVSPSIHAVESWSCDSVYQTHEIFGPDLFFAPIDSLDEGIAAVNSSQYGLSFSCFVKQESQFEYVADRVNAGLCYWNRPTVGASGRLPFGGWGRSGNHRPAGLFAILASTQVQTRIL